MAKSTQLGSLGEIQVHGPTMVMVRGVIMGKSREKFFDGNSDENFPMRNVYGRNTPLPSFEISALH